MPTIFSHAILAGAIGASARPTTLSSRFWILTTLCAIVPDFDVISFPLGFSYGSLFGHRGITHSVFFALLTGLVVASIFFARAQKAKWKLALYFAGVTFSHPLLDMLTNGGLGVALFAPFSNARYFLPWRPIQVSPIGVGFFSERGVAVIISEFLWIWLPSAALVGVSQLVRRKR